MADQTYTLEKERLDYLADFLESEKSEQFNTQAWEAYLAELSKVDTDTRWEMGDWLVKGADHYGERADVVSGRTLPTVYAVAQNITGLSYGTLRDLCSTARRCPVSVRTDKLSWSHHRVLVNALPKAEEETLKERLQDAVENGLSVAEFKESLKPSHQNATLTKSFVVEVPISVWDTLTDIADEEDQTVAELAAEWLSWEADKAETQEKREQAVKTKTERRRGQRSKVGRRVARTYNNLGLQR